MDPPSKPPDWFSKAKALIETMGLVVGLVAKIVSIWKQVQH
jgi:hypothetical protein